MADAINHPSHYADKDIEVIDYIFDTLTPEEATGYCIGNVLKYVSRWRKKGGPEDLEKAKVYLGWAIERANAEAVHTVLPVADAEALGIDWAEDHPLYTVAEGEQS